MHRKKLIWFSTAYGIKETEIIRTEKPIFMNLVGENLSEAMPKGIRNNIEANGKIEKYNPMTLWE